jgi:cytochrome c oxidase cbb3-type subunit 1
MRHYQAGLAGVMLYVLLEGGAGISLGVALALADNLGRSATGFNEVMAAMRPYYLLRFLSAPLFLAGAALMAW